MSNKKLSEQEKKKLSEQKSMINISNKDLVCRNCMFRLDDIVKLGNVSKCEIYESKPNEVLLGGKCERYTKE